MTQRQARALVLRALVVELTEARLGNRTWAHEGDLGAELGRDDENKLRSQCHQLQRRMLNSIAKLEAP